jgi:hypothetical protein
MKRSLIASLMAVTALGSLIALAGVNPHISEVKLNIEGVDPGQKFTPGPGGFVAKGGWKKITLSYSGPALRVRLNRNSTKIGVYTDTTGTTAIPNDKVWDVENGETLPAELWIKGEDVSTSGPTTTTCGPEHICLEAINNGTSYVTNLYDRVGFTVFDMKIKTKNKGAPAWDELDTTTEIAAGGLASALHYADVEIELLPADCVNASRPLSISLTKGAGYLPPESVQWWWPPDVHKRALLDLGSAVYEYGVTVAPISLTTWSGSLAGALRSSNKVEPTMIHCEWNSSSVDREVNFGGGDIVLEMPQDFEPYTWQTATCTRSLNGNPMQGHMMILFCKQVTQMDGTVVASVLGSSAATSRVLESYIWVGSHPSPYYDTGQGISETVCTGVTGISLFNFNKRGCHEEVEMYVVDLNAAM